MMKYRKPKIRRHLIEKPFETWDEVSKKIIEEAENGVITIAEAHQKLHDSFQKKWADPDGNYMEPIWELEELAEKNKFKSLNVHGNVYQDLVQIAKEDNRSIASTVALMTKDYRYARREKRKINAQLKELQDFKMKKIFGVDDEG
jgi:hypothetical protein